MKINQNKRKGFTLVEMTVALGLFTIVMFIATSAFLSIVNADRKSRSVRIAADNLNIALEDMSRRIKTGNEYECNGHASFPSAGTADCAGGADNIVFTDQNSKRTEYYYDNGTHSIWRTITGETTEQVTSPEITINNLKFIVTGSSVGDQNQPFVVIVIDGTLGSGATNSSFKIQTSVTQRAYDI